jgi:hypothetical protein
MIPIPSAIVVSVKPYEFPFEALKGFLSPDGRNTHPFTTNQNKPIAATQGQMFNPTMEKPSGSLRTLIACSRKAFASIDQAVVVTAKVSRVRTNQDRAITLHSPIWRPSVWRATRGQEKTRTTAAIAT